MLATNKLCLLLLLTTLFPLIGCNSQWFYRPNDHRYTHAYPYPIKPMQLVIPSNSGNNLSGLYFSASNNQSLLVHFHGNAGNISGTSRKFNWLVKHGFNVLTFDYSGYGKSSGDASPQSIAKDATSILNFSLSFADRKNLSNITLAGTSLGGNVLLQALAHNLDASKFQQVIIDSSFLSYRNTASHVIRKGPLGNYLDWIPNYLISEQLSALNAMQQLPQIPYLVTHCTTDALIPIEFGEQIFQQIPSANKQMWKINNCGHARAFEAEEISNRHRLKEFLQQNVLSHLSKHFNNQPTHKLTKLEIKDEL
ncbi:alpha/beta hydrolase [Pelagibaculum spongiae]|uniref:Serine aminopeptidase S33 domain-containing protein n=1 Tax=Pelagibaculum spongiae TaxID=2080658 RepID=A0A2V1GX45_9GAMM|nr:alpha/beta hydrolase [Pelagibaculum spongiae]PVZ70223.1 hypothetical protein DC094_06370 [Pelagibaculum spongiae]